MQMELFFRWLYGYRNVSTSRKKRMNLAANKSVVDTLSKCFKIFCIDRFNLIEPKDGGVGALVNNTWNGMIRMAQNQVPYIMPTEFPFALHKLMYRTYLHFLLWTFRK